MGNQTSLAQQGYSCNIGNKLVPSKQIDNNTIQFSSQNATQSSSNQACINSLNPTPTPSTNPFAPPTINTGFQITCSLNPPYGTTTSNGAGGSTTSSPQFCETVYNNLGLQTFGQVGFMSDSNVSTPPVMGKQDGSTYTCASIDGVNCIMNESIDTYISQPLNNIVCTSAEQQINNSPNLCSKAFEYWNLYPSTNPLVIRGRNINQGLINNITDPNILGNLANTYSKSITDSNSTSGINTGLNEILSETPLKLGCCSRISTNNTSQIANIKVPLSPTIAQENSLLKSFNFQKENIVIPAETCPANLYSTSQDCNSFYGVYCENVINQFNNSNLPQSEFLNYSPECACYLPKTKEQQYYPAGTPSICYKDGCVQNSISYLDPSSQGQQCSMTVCQNIVNAAGLTSGGSSNISPTLQNNCGQYLPSENNSSTNPDNSNSNPSSSSNNIIPIIIIIISIILIILIIYFFINKKNNNLSIVKNHK